MTKSTWICDRIPRAGLLLLTALALASCADITEPTSGGTARDQRSQSLVQLGDAARQTGDLSGAVQLYRNALMENPSQVDVMLILGGTLFQGGDNAEAIESYNKVLALTPQRADAHLGLGRVYLAESKPNQARVEFAVALQSDPKNVKAFNDLGVALDMLGQHSDAQQSYTKGLVLAPDDAALRNNLGLSMAISGNYEKAVAELSNLSLEPDSMPRIRQNLALALGLNGDAEGAAKLLRADLDEQAVRGDLRYFAVLRQLSQSAPVSNPLPVATADPSPAPTAAIATVPLNPTAGTSPEAAQRAKRLLQSAYVLPATTTTQNPPTGNAVHASVQSAAIYVEAGAFSVMDNAKPVATRLESIGARISTIIRGGRPLYCVQIGPFGNMDQANQVLASVRNLGQKDVTIVASNVREPKSVP